MRPLLLLVLAFCACGPPQRPPTMAIHAEPPQTFYVQNDNGRTLMFEQALVNETDSTQTLFAFAYAADNVSQPPARSVYPPRALASMPRDRRFGVSNPAHGMAITLPPGDTVRFSGALPVPTTWPDGQTIPSDTFRDFSLFLYSEAGRNVFHRMWPLQRLEGETRSAAP